MHGFSADASALIIQYPKLKIAQLLATKSTNYIELQRQSKTWDKNSPFLKDYELVAIDDLTHNNIMLRQINASQIINRLLKKALEDNDFATKSFEFPADFYGDKSYWLRLGLFLKPLMLIFIVLYIVQTTLLRVLLSILGRFDKLFGKS